MYKIIWKYQIPINDKFAIEIPVGSQVLSVQMQKGSPCIWVLVNPDNKLASRAFNLVGTGQKLPSDWDCTKKKFIGTFQMAEGNLVYHLFETLKT